MRDWKRLVEVLESVNSDVIGAKVTAVCSACAAKLRIQQPMSMTLAVKINNIVADKTVSPHIQELLREAWVYLEMEYLNQFAMRTTTQYVVHPSGQIDRQETVTSKNP